MNKKLTTAVLALLVAGGGIASAGSLVANAYDTTDPTADTTTVEPTVEPTIETTVDNDGVPQALTAQVETDTDTDTDTDETDTPASPDATDGERPGREGHGRRGGCGGNEAVAELLGMTPEELHDAEEAGSSLADIAESQGVAVDEVIQAIVDEKAEHLAEEVAEGDLTQAEADARLAEIQARTADRVNGVDAD